MRLIPQLVVVLTCVALFSTEVSPAPPVPPSGLLVTIGETAAEHATLWIRADTAAPARVRYGVAGAERAAREAEVALAEDRDNTGRLRLGPLARGTRYAYEVTQGTARVEGTFVTAPPPDGDAPARLLWSGDLGGGGHCRRDEGYTIFRAMTRHRPDLFLFVGDTMYADHVCRGENLLPGADFVASTRAEFQGKHRYNRADPELQAFFRSTSVFAIWDDHEVRNNFAGPSEPLTPIALDALLDYWPIAGPPEEPRRLYRSVRWGRHLEIFILDVRQYRSVQSELDGPAKTMLGAAQRAWLLRRLAESDATWKLVVSPVPLGMYTGGRHSDSWSNANLFGYPRATPGGYVHERDGILEHLRAHAIRNVVFVGADVHHAEAIRHEPSPGFFVHEVIAGPLAARPGFPRFLDHSLRSRSLGSLGFVVNFGELVASGTALRVRVFDEHDVARVSLSLRADGAASPALAEQRDQRRRAQR